LARQRLAVDLARKGGSGRIARCAGEASRRAESRGLGGVCECQAGPRAHGRCAHRDRVFHAHRRRSLLIRRVRGHRPGSGWVRLGHLMQGDAPGPMTAPSVERARAGSCPWRPLASVLDATSHPRTPARVLRRLGGSYASEGDGIICLPAQARAACCVIVFAESGTGCRAEYARSKASTKGRKSLTVP